MREFYEKISGSYENVMERFQKETLIRRFALMFLKDPSFAELEKSLAEGRTADAFRAAHTLKGVAMNLAFTKLAGSASEITEYLRSGDQASAEAYFPRVQADYELIIEELNKLA